MKNTIARIILSIFVFHYINAPSPIGASSINFSVDITFSGPGGYDYSFGSSYSNVTGTASNIDPMNNTNSGGESSLAQASGGPYLVDMKAGNYPLTMYGFLSGNGPDGTSFIDQNGINQTQLGAYNGSTGWSSDSSGFMGEIAITAHYQFAASLNQTGGNPFQQVAWAAFLSWGENSFSNVTPIFIYDPQKPLTGSGDIIILMPIYGVNMWSDEWNGYWIAGFSGSRILKLELSQYGTTAGSPSPIPLPSTMILLGSSLLGLAGWRRFRKG
jgi:hypothetical protein